MNGLVGVEWLVLHGRSGVGHRWVMDGGWRRKNRGTRWVAAHNDGRS